MTKKHKKGMVFGVFDVFHPGHVYFLNEAASRCEELTVVVTHPEVVMLLKNKNPRNSLEERVCAVKKNDDRYNVVTGDSTIGGWQVLRDNQFDIIFLGYDQQGIAKELDRLKVNYEILDSHYPEKYKSSLL
jgi:FAD synthetase